MESREHVETIRKHEVKVTAWQQSARAWTWSHLITTPSGRMVEGKATRARQTAEEALRQGIAAAKARLAELVP